MKTGVRRLLTGLLCGVLLYSDIMTAEVYAAAYIPLAETSQNVLAEDEVLPAQKEELPDKSAGDMSGEDIGENEDGDSAFKEEDTDETDSDVEDGDENPKDESQVESGSEENSGETESESNDDEKDEEVGGEQESGTENDPGTESENPSEDEEDKTEGNNEEESTDSEEAETDDEIDADQKKEEKQREAAMTAELDIVMVEDDIASGSVGTTLQWVINAEGELTVVGTGEISDRNNTSRAPWYGYRSQIISAKISLSNIQDMSYFFYDCRNMVNVDISELDASSVTSMKRMFYDCRSLESLDINGLDTSNVTDMESMFYYCKNMTGLDGGSLNTTNVTDTSDMFYYCSKLERLDTSGFQTSKVTDMHGMFHYCSSLTALDVSGFNTMNVTNMGGMFSECGKLKVLDVGKFQTGLVTDMNAMFFNCVSLESVDVSGFDTGKVTNMAGMFANCGMLSSLDVSKFVTNQVMNMGSMFQGCSHLAVLDVSKFDTHKVTNMEQMFSGCQNLEILNVSGFDTSSVTNLGNMFANCSKVTQLDVSGFSTGNVTMSMSSMFMNCASLINLNLSSFNTRSVKGMAYMFSGCTNLTGLDLSNFDTSQLKGSLSGMFKDCNSLTSLDLSNFNTENVTDMTNMFSGCANLQSLNISNFNTTNTTKMYGMFEFCGKLTDLDMSSFDTTKVKDMWSMFRGCSSLTTLDLSGFDFSAVTAVNKGMLENCGSLARIHTPRNFNYSTAVELPKNDAADKWYDAAGIVYTELPRNRTDSIILTKNKKPDILYLEVKKTKKDYEYQEPLNMDDLTVIFYDGNGTASVVTDYTTNAAEIDMGSLGKKELIVTWQYESKSYTASIELSVKRTLKEEEMSITLLLPSGQTVPVYTGEAQTPDAEVRIGNTVLEKDADYIVFYHNNVDAGNRAELIVTGKDNYRGNVTHYFTIDKAESPQAEEMIIYVPYNKPQTNSKLDFSDIFSLYGEVVGYHLQGCEENNVLAGNVISGVPLVSTDGILTYSTNEGEEGDFADIRIQVSFANYKDTLLTVRVVLTAKKQVEIKGIEIPAETIYTGRRVSYNGAPTVIRKEADGSEIDLTDSLELIFSYSGKQINGDAYHSPEAPVNAGEYVLTVAVTDANEEYTGSLTCEFVISRAPVKIIAMDQILALGDALVYEYSTLGLLNGDSLVREPSFECDAPNMTTLGEYTITPKEADAGNNYEISYQPGRLVIAEERVAYTVTFDLAGVGNGEAFKPIVGIKAGSLINDPNPPEDTEGYIFKGWYKDPSYTKAWDFQTDTVQEDITLYACWITTAAESGTEGMNLCVQRIQDQSYTGKALKPSILVYSADGETLLKAGKDYTVKYYNNIDADTPEEYGKGGAGKAETDTANGFTTDIAYIVIKGKGNYTGAIYSNFHILPADIATQEQEPGPGVALKYSDQMTVNTKKAQRPFSSLKYKKTMKEGTDYQLKLTALTAFDAENKPVESGRIIDDEGRNPAIPVGYRGSFLLTVSGINNYTGTIQKTIYVQEKSHLLKSATVSLGKNQKKIKYVKEQQKQGITLTPGYYDTEAKKYYVVKEDGTISEGAEANGDNLFTVKAGKEYLVYGRDYVISYSNNRAVGSAVMAITGIGAYSGVKNVKFEITGNTFNAKTIQLEEGSFNSTLIYTGKALTQNGVLLRPKQENAGGNDPLVYGKDYTISYKNNLNKGKATMTFKAKLDSGYKGSFSKSFKIIPAQLTDQRSVTIRAVADTDRVVQSTDNTGNMILIGEVSYRKEGATPADKILLINSNDLDAGENEGVLVTASEGVLRAGVDYTVSYANHKEVTKENVTEKPVMIVKGKGNYAGSVKIEFTITPASFTDNHNLTVTTVPLAYNSKKGSDYEYKPAVKILDGKKRLTVNTDYQVNYVNCEQSAVAAYLEAITAKPQDVETLNAMKPRAVISEVANGNYRGAEMVVDLTLYQNKLTAGNLYVIISDKEDQTVYKGIKVTPEVEVYYGIPADIKAAKRAGEVKEEILTASGNGYRLTKLTQQKDYTVSYGSNLTAGKNKGSVTITGTGLYGGNVTVKFNIVSQKIYGTN